MNKFYDITALVLDQSAVLRLVERIVELKVETFNLPVYDHVRESRKKLKWSQLKD